MKFDTYAGTLQETCLRLMGKKMLVALMMEGKFSGEGLQSLDTDEDLMSAMARELVEKAGVGKSADAIWRKLDHERDKVQPRPAVVEMEEEPAPSFRPPSRYEFRTAACLDGHSPGRTSRHSKEAQEAFTLADRHPERRAAQTLRMRSASLTWSVRSRNANEQASTHPYGLLVAS